MGKQLPNVDIRGLYDECDTFGPRTLASNTIASSRSRASHKYEDFHVGTNDPGLLGRHGFGQTPSSTRTTAVQRLEQLDVRHEQQHQQHRSFFSLGVLPH